MIDAATNLGLVEVSSVRGTVDTTETGDFNPDLRVEVAFHPDSRRLPPALAGGVLVAHVVPGGELFLGRSAAMRLAGWTWEEMTLAAPLGQHVAYPEQVFRRRWWSPPDAEEKFDKAKKEKPRRLEEMVAAARGYDRARRAMESGAGGAIDVDHRFEALRPLVAGEATLFLWANEKTQIEKALDWVGKEGFARVVLVSGPDAALLAERLAAARIPVILHDVLMTPTRDEEPYDAPFTAAARLHAAGVEIAFADGGDSSNARNLPFHAAMAVAFGPAARGRAPCADPRRRRDSRHCGPCRLADGGQGGELLRRDRRSARHPHFDRARRRARRGDRFLAGSPAPALGALPRPPGAGGAALTADTGATRTRCRSARAQNRTMAGPQGSIGMPRR
jgi:hypothetical protein